MNIVDSSVSTTALELLPCSTTFEKYQQSLKVSCVKCIVRSTMIENY